MDRAPLGGSLMVAISSELLACLEASYLPFGLDGGKAARGFALLFLAPLRGTSRMEPVGKLPFTARRGWKRVRLSSIESVN